MIDREYCTWKHAPQPTPPRYSAGPAAARRPALKVAAAAPYPQEPPATTTTGENEKPEPVAYSIQKQRAASSVIRTGEGERGGVVCGLGAVAGGREGEQLREQGEREQKRWGEADRDGHLGRRCSEVRRGRKDPCASRPGPAFIHHRTTRHPLATGGSSTVTVTRSV
jgi:hypothetical protein